MEDWFIDLIKKYEGFRPKAYWDVDHYSIGYGSDTMPNGKPVAATDTITEQEAAKLIPEYIQKKEQYIKKYFPDYDNLPQQVKYALIDQVYRGGQGALAKSPKYVAAIKNALADRAITIDEMPEIIKELEIYTPDKEGKLYQGIQNRKRRRAAMLLGVYNPKHNSSVGERENDFYYTFDKDYNNPNTLWGQILRTKNLPQNFTTRLWDTNRETMDLGNGKIGTHKLSYKTEDNYDVIYPEIQQKILQGSGFWFWKKPTRYTQGLVDYSKDRDKAWQTALQMGDTIHVPEGMGEQFTKEYKNYIPGFKSGNKLSYLNYYN